MGEGGAIEEEAAGAALHPVRAAGSLVPGAVSEQALQFGTLNFRRGRGGGGAGGGALSRSLLEAAGWKNLVDRQGSLPSPPLDCASPMAMSAGDGTPLQVQPCGDADAVQSHASTRHAPVLLHRHGGGEKDSQRCGPTVHVSDGRGGFEGLRERSYRRGALVAGNYCHDIIQLPGGVEAEVLGGSVSYIGNVFDAVGLDCHVVSKVGPDFAYGAAVRAHPPRIVAGQATTQFFADFRSGGERILRAGNICEQIFAGDIPADCGYQIGLVVGVAGEIRVETLEQMATTSGCVVVDIQALIRTIDPVTGAVGLSRLEDTPFNGLLDRISFLKAASSEAAYIDLDYARKRTCVIVTEGRKGCRVYSDKIEFVVPPFAAEEVDPTGAGDSFLAGFCAGLLNGFSVDKAVLMGNYFGALAVGQVGVPRFSASQLQGWGCNTLRPVSDGYYETGLMQGVCKILENDHLLAINNRVNHCLGAGSVCSQ